MTFIDYLVCPHFIPQSYEKKYNYLPLIIKAQTYDAHFFILRRPIDKPKPASEAGRPLQKTLSQACDTCHVEDHMPNLW